MVDKVPAAVAAVMVDDDQQVANEFAETEKFLTAAVPPSWGRAELLCACRSRSRASTSGADTTCSASRPPSRTSASLWPMKASDLSARYGGMENPCLTFVTPTLLAGDRR
eukprot:767344-Hanusia_phi.AAC.2